MASKVRSSKVANSKNGSLTPTEARNSTAMMRALPSDPDTPKIARNAEDPQYKRQTASHERSLAETLDLVPHAMLARLTGGLSPFSVYQTWLDWAVHLTASPGKQMELWQKGLDKLIRAHQLALHTLYDGENCTDCIAPLPQDYRFRHEEWRKPPFNLYYQNFLLIQQWWHNATTGVKGVTAEHERAMQFMTRQLLDVLSPSNFPLTNPEVQERTRAEMGLNLLRGMRNLQEDAERLRRGKPPVGAEKFVVGDTVAATPGKVVYSNHLIELIQYSPTTDKVRHEPLLIVPAWVMKYYILDLSPHNSLVRYLVGQGFTVFMISWRNPGSDDRDLSMQDYLRLGPLAAMEAIKSITGADRLHAAGYCLGGTLLSIAAAALARDGDDLLASVSLFATQNDYSEAGELKLFINESEISFLEDMMRGKGFLEARQMAGAFQILRSNDLIWSRILRVYLLGERPPMTDLMAWNSDATRMPFRMHSEYLRMFMDNSLAAGRFNVDGRPVTLSDIRLPIFALGTETDHVAPWKSVYKITFQTDTDVTFILASGGHNTGVISQPGLPGHHYRIQAHRSSNPYLPPDDWFAETTIIEGSWWPAWSKWLAARSGPFEAPPPMGTAVDGDEQLPDAPGRYVLQH